MKAFLFYLFLSLLGGTQAFAGVDAYVSAPGDITLAAGADTYMSDGMSAGVNLQFTGPAITGGGFNFSESESESTTWTGADLSAGNILTVIAGNDLTLTGANITGDSVDISVGNDLSVTSVQDTHSSESSGFGVTIGLSAPGSPGGAGNLAGFGFNVSSSESESAQTNDGMSGIIGTGETSISVGNHTALVGGAIASESGELFFDTASLSTQDVHDYEESSSFSFGLNLNQGAFKPSSQQAGSDYQSPFIGEVSIGMSGSIKQGITYTVVGEGQIVIGDGEVDPETGEIISGTGNAILATIKRDLEGRQVVTMESSYGFEVTIPLVNFEQLAFEANRIDNFITALTAPIPPEVATNLQ